MHKKQGARKGRKKLIIILACVVAAAGIIAGIVVAVGTGGGEVAVYPVEDFTTGADWATGAQTDGLVTTDQLQSVYVSSTQQVTEVYVQEGQEVKIGDPIMAFDTTLSEISLQRQAIKVDQLKLDIQNAQKELEEIGTYKIGSPSSYVPPADGGSTSSGGTGPVVEVPYERTGSGLGTAADPLIYLWDDSCTFNETFIQQAVALATENREKAMEPEPTDEPAPTGEPIETEEPTPTDEPTPTEEPTESDDPTPTEEPEQSTTPEESSTPESTVTGDGTEPAGQSDASEPVPLAMAAGSNAAITRLFAPARVRFSPADVPAGEPLPEGGTLPEGIDDPRVYVVFEVRDANTLEGDILRAWEMVLLLSDDGTWSVQIIEPDYDPGESGSSNDDWSYDDFYYDTTVYYTASEIAQMKTECSKKIRDLQLQLKTAGLEYERLNYELSNGEVYSKIDGVVKTVRDVDEARSENKPVVLVSGGGGYYVTAVLGELELDTMQVGDTVSISNWETGEQCEGAITEISEYPDESGQYWYYSEGNQNVSTYPFKVFVNEDANLREGSWVTVSYSAAGAEGEGMFLDMMFVRQENGKNYIYAAGEDERLEKRFVKTGKNLWGSYVEITEGLTAEEHIAFPYGRSVKDGAKIRYAESDELYSSYY